MKKVIIVAMAAMLSFGSFAIMNATTSSYPTTIEMAEGYTITVYKISGSGEHGVTIKRQGYYDEDNQTLTVGKETYRVRRNPRYGDGTRFGKYPFCAGDFYFYL